MRGRNLLLSLTARAPFQASAGRSLLDTSAMERGRGGEVIGSAAVLEGTHLCSTLQLRDMLPCLGGVSVLLPFIAQVALA